MHDIQRRFIWWCDDHAGKRDLFIHYDTANCTKNITAHMPSAYGIWILKLIVGTNNENRMPICLFQFKNDKDPVECLSA